MERFRRLTRAAAGLWLATGVAVGLGGCAFVDGLGAKTADTTDTAEAGGDRTWLGYFSGEDLHAACSAGETDETRLVYWGGGHTDFQAIEIIANVAGGALILHHRVGPHELAAGAPTDDWWRSGERQALSPSGYAAVVYWLDRLGLFTPTPFPTPGGSGPVSWVFSGCIGGNWIFNLSLPDDAGGTGAGVEVGDDRRRPDNRFSGPVRVWPPSALADPSGSMTPAPAVKPRGYPAHLG